MRGLSPTSTLPRIFLAGIVLFFFFLIIMYIFTLIQFDVALPL